MNEFLKRKGVQISAKVYLIDALGNMALGIFASLVVGLIIKTIGEQAKIEYFIGVGQLAMDLMGAAIGVSVAYGLKAPPLVLFSAVISGAAGAQFGGPAGSVIAAIISTEIGKLISGETKIDIILTPFLTILVGFTVGKFIGPGIDYGMKAFGNMIMWGTEQRPLMMGVIVAVLVGVALSSPISSAGVALMLDLHGIAAGAATIGCAAQMVGFASASFRENRVGGLFALGIGTSKLMLPNIFRNPLILLPPTIAGALLAPISTTVWYMENNAAGAGMGTSGLVGQIMTFTTMGFNFSVLLKILLLHFIGPAILSLLLSEYMRRKGWIKFGDMKINIGGSRLEKA